MPTETVEVTIQVRVSIDADAVNTLKHWTSDKVNFADLSKEEQKEALIADDRVIRAVHNELAEMPFIMQNYEITSVYTLEGQPLVEI